MKKVVIVLTSVLATVGAMALFTSAKAVLGSADGADGTTDSSALTPGRIINQDDFTAAAEATVNGVVCVKSYATPSRGYSRGGNNSFGDFFNDPFFEFFFGQPQQRQAPRTEPKSEPQQIGLGSGVIISKDGYIVTNNHVIADAERLEVTLNDNRNFTATVVGADATTDLALIKIDADDLHVIPIGDSEQLKLGEWVLAVGNPFGFTSSVTAGIVSAKARNISSSTQTPPSGGIESYIQTDAAVNRGNSGGALVNLRGELVGINTAIYSQTGTYAGCSFAIPTTIIKKVIDDIKKYGTVQRAYLGIEFVELTPKLVTEKEIKGVNAGIYVAKVVERSAAMAMGLREGDVIVSLAGHPTLSTAQLQEAIARCSPGDKVEIVFYRDGEKKSDTVVLRNSQGNTAITHPDNASSLGAKFVSVNDDLRKLLGINGGVQVSEVNDGRFANAGIRSTFIILEINGSRVSSADDIEKIYNAIRKSSDSNKVMFITGIYPNGKADYYAVNLND